MNAREMRRALAAADPVGRERLDGLDFEAMEADLLADVDGEREALEVEPARTRLVGRSRLALGIGVASVAALVVVFLILGGGSGEPTKAYNADLVRFAESTPLLLLEGPGWRVQDVTESRSREGTEGQMEFVTGKPIPYETLQITGNEAEGERVEGLAPAAVRQRRVELRWRPEAAESLAEVIANRREYIHPHGKHFVRLPVLDTTAFVDTRPEVFVNQGGPGDREMLALWSEAGYVLEMHAAVADLAGMEERLDWLTKVDSTTWLDAMPAKVVKAADHRAAVAGMLRGIPLPRTFAPSRVPDEGLTTNRYQVGANVAGTVACLWLRQWGEAQRTGDTAAAAEAVRAMATARHWPILREMSRDGAYPQVLWEIAAAMPQGYFGWDGHHRDLLAHAEGLGCARFGLPLVPAKMKHQRERGVPPPPD
ncbi:MAG: hypothetical protein JSS68_06745 [Actinobacteria bacterium]|nr:hypothetical protein [Actinomycetota bacterium]